MKHHYLDGRGFREVWLDGMLLDAVIECDDEAATALYMDKPFKFVDGEVPKVQIQGDVMVVLAKGLEYRKI